MSQNCKSACGAATRDANNNTLCAGPANRAFQPPTTPPSYQVTAKVLFGSVAAINDLKLREKADRETRRTH